MLIPTVSNIIFIAIVGLIMGSFINATAGRWGTTRQNTSRSKCFYCGTILQWISLVPVLSWLYQRGRCRDCYSRLPLRYPLIEFVTAGLFAGALYISTSIIGLLFNVILFTILVFIALIDVDQYIIPHEFSIGLALLSFSTLFFDYSTLNAIYPTFIDVMAGPILALFYWVLWLLTRGRGMGFADGTLALSVGWLLGLWSGIVATVFAFWVGTAVSLGIILYQKIFSKPNTMSMKSAVPFGPFIIIGFLIVYVLDLSILIFV